MKLAATLQSRNRFLHSQKSEKYIMYKLVSFFLFCLFTSEVWTQQPVSIKPRVLVSTDIEGSVPDDNQSTLLSLPTKHGRKTVS
jgi:hypothetical protein